PRGHVHVGGSPHVPRALRGRRHLRSDERAAPRGSRLRAAVKKREAGAGPRPPGDAPLLGGAYWTFAVSELAALKVKVQVGVLAPALEHAPDQITDRPAVALRVIRVPTAKLAEPVVPTGTLSPAGLERTFTPARPVAVRVRSAAAGATPQTL